MPPKLPLVATQHPHLSLRGRIFYFRMAMGSQNRWEICFSLKTSEPKTAKLLAARIKARLFDIMDDKKLELSNPKVRDQLRSLARSYFETELEKLNEDIALSEGMPEWDPLQLALDTQEHIKEKQTQLRMVRFPSYITAAARESLEAHMMETQNDLEIQVYLKKLFMRAEIEAQRIFLAKIQGENWDAKPQDELFEGISPDIIRPIPTFGADGYTLEYGAKPRADTDKTFKEAVDAFLAFKKAKNKDSKTVDDIGHIMNVFSLLEPDVRHLKDLTKTALISFETKLADVPANFTKIPALKNLTFAQLVEKGRDLPKYSDVTYDKYCIYLRSFIRWCQENEWLASWSPPKFEPRNKGAGKDKRHPFTPEELEKFFSSPQYTGHRPDTGKQFTRYKKGDRIERDYFYWVPLVALYCGMRLGEIMQLHVSDVREEKKTLYFDVNDDGTDKSLKNQGSKRRVELLPNDQTRFAYRNRLEKSQIPLFDSTELWKKWPDAVKDSGLFSPSLKD